MKNSIIIIFILFINLSCVSNNPNKYYNPNKAAIIEYKNLLKNVEKYSVKKGFGNRKIVLNGIQNAYKLELITNSGVKYQCGHHIITKKISDQEIDYWKEWFYENKNYIEWDYIEAKIFVNDVYKDSIRQPASLSQDK